MKPLGFIVCDNRGPLILCKGKHYTELGVMLLGSRRGPATVFATRREARNAISRTNRWSLGDYDWGHYIVRLERAN